jgi:hypothetical protein
VSSPPRQIIETWLPELLPGSVTPHCIQIMPLREFRVAAHLMSLMIVSGASSMYVLQYASFLGSGPWFPGSVTPGMRHQARHCIHIVALPEVAARLMELINVAGYPSAATMLLCPRCRCCSILAFWARDRNRKGSA